MSYTRWETARIRIYIWRNKIWQQIRYKPDDENENIFLKHKHYLLQYIYQDFSMLEDSFYYNKIYFSEICFVFVCAGGRGHSQPLLQQRLAYIARCATGYSRGILYSFSAGDG